MSVHQKGGRKSLGRFGRLAQRRKEFEALDSDKQRSRKRPGSMSGRK